ncbi:MAG: hypothetical protein GXO89_05035 [Chlorobi bacterium]|nr:hypothetical protein [Chlorobiota bacterium]
MKNILLLTNFSETARKAITAFVRVHLESIQQNQIGLLALIDHRINMISKLFASSVTGNFASRAEVPLL